MSEEYLKNAQDLTKSQKHEFVSDSPTWIQEMLAHLKRETIKTTLGRHWTLSLRYILEDLLKKCQRNFRSPLEISGKQDGGEHLEEPEWIQEGGWT